MNLLYPWYVIGVQGSINTLEAQALDEPVSHGRTALRYSCT